MGWSTIEDQACKMVIERAVSKGVRSKEELQRVKLEVARDLGLGAIPSDKSLIIAARELGHNSLLHVLRKRPVRSLSGVTVITVVVPPFNCPHGSCVYCPGGPGWDAPKSYTGQEQVVRIGRTYNYDPAMMVREQVKKIEALGHVVDKVELIIVGGTFSALPLTFQRSFIKRCIDEFNGVTSESLEEALDIAEGASIRVVGITVETKPEFAKLKQANYLLEMGVTRVELGVQALDDWVYSLVNRGHTLRDVIVATRTLRDLAFKVGYHMMPGLPGSSPEDDIEAFERLFRDPDFRPDNLKIYPTLVLPGTQLHKWWLRGWYKPYDQEVLVDLLVRCMSLAPPYARINRVQREIPSHVIAAGNKLGNIRQLVEEEMRRRGIRCRCIRCREIGRQPPWYAPKESDVKLLDREYEAGGGIEHFISFEDVVNDVLIGFLRLRIPGDVLRPELKGAALIRELHVYGEMVPVGVRSKGSWQHKEYGRRLLSEAERIAVEEYGLSKVVVISGVGVRRYYYRHGYRKDGPYVSKNLG